MIYLWYTACIVVVIAFVSGLVSCMRVCAKNGAQSSWAIERNFSIDFLCDTIECLCEFKMHITYCRSICVVIMTHTKMSTHTPSQRINTIWTKCMRCNFWYRESKTTPATSKIRTMNKNAWYCPKEYFGSLGLAFVFMTEIICLLVWEHVNGCRDISRRLFAEMF